MADNINYAKGKHSFASAVLPAWHNLGQIVDHAMTSEEAIVASGLDFTVKLTPVVGEVYNKSIGRNIPLETNKFITYRDDIYESLGVVGARYEPLQNVNAFDFFDEIVGSKEAIYETAGALGNGEIIFITAKLPNQIRIGNSDDVTDMYLLLTTSHDGSGATKVMFTPTRVVCANTLASGINNAKRKFSVRHTVNAKNRLEEGKKILQVSHVLSDELNEIFNAMSKTRVSDNVVEKYITNVFYDSKELQSIVDGNSNEVISTRKRNTVKDTINYYHTGVGQDMITTKGTLWGAYNAVTGYFQNNKSYTTNEKKFNSILTDQGTSKKLTERAFDLTSKYL